MLWDTLTLSWIPRTTRLSIQSGTSWAIADSTWPAPRAPPLALLVPGICNTFLENTSYVLSGQLLRWNYACRQPWIFSSRQQRCVWHSFTPPGRSRQALMMQIRKNFNFNLEQKVAINLSSLKFTLASERTSIWMSWKAGFLIKTTFSSRNVAEKLHNCSCSTMSSGVYFDGCNSVLCWRQFLPSVCKLYGDIKNRSGTCNFAYNHFAICNDKEND